MTVLTTINSPRYLALDALRGFTFAMMILVNTPGSWVLGGLGIVLGLIWSIWLPINKSLWTSSFVIYTAGYFCLALALFVWLVDIKKVGLFSTPLIIYGSNSIFIYMLAAF